LNDYDGYLIDYDLMDGTGEEADHARRLLHWICMYPIT
jgi:hypothetical protein